MSTPQDLEMQTPIPTNSLPQRLQDLMLGNVSNADREHIDLQPILQSLDRKIEAWPKESFLPGLIWLNIATDMATRQDIYEYFYRVITVLSGGVIENLSIDFIWKAVIAQEELSSSDSGFQLPEEAETILSLQRLTLASLGVLTMLFNWKSQSSDQQLSVSVTTARANVTRNQILRTAVARATGSMIRNLDCLPVAILENADQSNLLYLSSLNLASLINVGRIHIEWTDQLGSHLLFDPSLRTLKLFKFPSFCAITAQDSNLAKVFKK
jgi:hypothetical protein